MNWNPNKHAALAAELDRKRAERMAKLSAMYQPGRRQVEEVAPEPTPKKGRKGSKK